MIFRSNENDGFESSSVWGWLTSPFRLVVRFFSGLLQHNDTIDDSQSWLGRIVSIATFPFRVLLGIMVFMVQAWASSRQGSAFLWAIPAIAVIAMVILSQVVVDFIHNESRRIGTNQSYYNFQMKRSPDHPEYAEIFAEKLMMLQPQSLNNRYQLGVVKGLKGESFKAVDIMESLAPEDRPGFAPAHNWLASHYQRLKSEDESAGAGARYDDLIRKHLSLAIESDPGDQVAHFTLANLEIAELDQLEKDSAEYRMKMSSVIDHLIIIADAEITPETINLQLTVIPKLLQLQLEMGAERVARVRLQTELVRLGTLAKNLPDAQALEIRKVMVRTALSVKDYAQANEFLLQARRLMKTSEDLKQVNLLTSLVYRQRADDFTDMENRAQFSNRLNLLCEAFNLNPLDSLVAERLLEFIAPMKPSATVAGTEAPVDGTRSDASPDQPEIKLSWLKGLKTSSEKNMSVIHVLLGIHNISAGNISEGESHWRIADKQNERTQLFIVRLTQVLTINLADRFSHKLDMISMAIEMFPDQAVFYQTRGIYLESLGRFEEAATDLNYAVEKNPTWVLLHDHLIHCYQQLGEEEKVLEHQALLDEKLSKLDERLRQQVVAAIERRKNAK